MDENKYKSILATCAKQCLGVTLDKIGKRLEDRTNQKITYTQNDDGTIDATVSPAPNLKTMFLERSGALLNAIEHKDSDLILKLFKSKQLYEHVASYLRRHEPKVQLMPALQHYRYLQKMEGFHGALTSVDWFVAFRGKLRMWLFR
jgi:hypothetical protein